jgi:hypothetical protein
MPLVTMTFNLPEEEDAYNDARRGADYASAIDNLYNWLRSQYKYNAGDIDPVSAEMVRDYLNHELME